MTFAAVASAARISRSWLYARPDIAGQIRRLREKTTPGSAGNSPAPWATSGQPGPGQVTIQPHESRPRGCGRPVSDISATVRRRSQHWLTRKLKITIESTFATVHLRTKVTKGHRLKAAALAKAFKLIESAQRHWRMVNAPHLVVRAGATFLNGKLVERPGEEVAEAAQPEPPKSS